MNPSSVFLCKLQYYIYHLPFFQVHIVTLTEEKDNVFLFEQVQ